MMKKNFLVALMIVIAVIATSCKKKDEQDVIATEQESSSFSNTPDATPANNEKSGGVYKGVVTGSSGTVKIILQNDVVSALVTFDGVTKTLTTTSLNGWSSGQAISNAVFTAGDWELTFSVEADGSNPQMALDIPGHTVQVALIKETSEVQALTFEGVYTREDITFALNCVIQGDQVKFPGLTSVGGINGEAIVLNAPEKDFTLSAELKGDKITGTGNSVVTGDTTNLPGTWEAHRTL